MILSGRWRISQLIDQKHEYKNRLQALNIEINELKSYAQNIADGGVTIAELMRTPSSMYNRQLLYMNSAMNYSQMNASQNMQMLMATPYYQQMMANQTAQVQQSYQQMMYTSFYKQAQQQFSKYESNLLHEKEKAMEEEREALKEQLAAVEGELASTKQEVSKDISEFFNSKG